MSYLKPGSRGLYEPKTWSLNPDKQTVLDEYPSWAFIPAAKRIRVGPPVCC